VDSLGTENIPKIMHRLSTVNQTGFEPEKNA